MNLPARAPRRFVAAGWRRGIAAVGIVVALGGVFALYQRPDFLVMLADQAWSCF